MAHTILASNFHCLSLSAKQQQQANSNLAIDAGSVLSSSSIDLKNRKSSSEEKASEHTKNDTLWTSEQLGIVADLLKWPPRPFSRNRQPPPAPRQPPKHRPIPLPKQRHIRARYRKNINMAKNTFYLSHLAIQISELPDEKHVSTILDPCQYYLRKGSLSSTIRELGRLGKPLKALDTFLWQHDYPHLWHDQKTLCATIHVLGEANMESQARELINTWAPDCPLALQSLVRGLVFAKQLQSALDVKKEAEGYGFAFDQGLYAELILLASKLDKDQEVSTLVQEMGSFPELKLSLEHCTSVMAACRKGKLYEAVLRLFEWWKNSGHRSNVVMYEIVMTSLASMGKYRDAIGLYWEMEENGCAPDYLVYACLFDICLSLGECQKALRMFSRMKEAQITVTSDVYVTLIKICGKDGRVGKAKEFAEAMKRDGMTGVQLEDYIAV